MNSWVDWFWSRNVLCERRVLTGDCWLLKVFQISTFSFFRQRRNVTDPWSSLRFHLHFQVLYLSNNLLTDIPGELFREFSNLRVVELANNRLRVLPDILFTGVPMERLDVSRNQLSRVPFSSFSADAAESLVELDVSSNFIVALHSPDAFARFRVSLIAR